MANVLKLNNPEGLPYSEYEREFDYPAAEVFRAHADPELYRQWIGPRGLTTRIEEHDYRSGGSFRFVQHRGDGMPRVVRRVADPRAPEPGPQWPAGCVLERGRGVGGVERVGVGTVGVFENS